MNDEDREDAIRLLRRHALNHAGEQSYLPMTEYEADTFVPHEWVIQAVMEAQR